MAELNASLSADGNMVVVEKDGKVYTFISTNSVRDLFGFLGLDFVNLILEAICDEAILNHEANK